MNFLIRQIAINDIKGISAFIAKDSSQNAKKFVSLVYKTIENICSHPNASELYKTNIRHRPLVEFRRYVIFYEIKNNVIEIKRIIHTSRDLTKIRL